MLKLIVVFEFSCRVSEHVVVLVTTVGHIPAEDVDGAVLQSVKDFS